METTTSSNMTAKAQFQAGLQEMASGLEKIKSSESLFVNDPWFFDWIQILDSRLKVLRTAGEHELGIHESMMLDSLTE